MILVVDGDPAPDSGPGGPLVAPPRPDGPTGPAPADDSDEHIDPSDLRDADDVATTGVDLLLREFGGGEVVEEEP